ncbi:hypothetical protein TNCT_186861 [Trichonephila clavata]|uniref:Uncharacterized protein n=1 Tax=Trichonephila clavata TaxID=2740835 RepID=A0A8X6FKD9_TRICU|nr:hypothetical protein TNCT_186861 [Trichonephila clavata]
MGAIASELGISHGSEYVHRILHDDLNIHCVCLHMVTKMLSHEQKEMKLSLSSDFIDMADEDKGYLKKNRGRTHLHDRPIAKGIPHWRNIFQRSQTIQ